jgi:putative protein kinase ArgK-like GTPase of G3E family
MLAMGINIAIKDRDGKPLWQVPVVGTSSETGEGIKTLIDTLDKHRNVHLNTELGEERLRQIAEYRTFKTAEDLLRNRFFKSTNKTIKNVVEQIAKRESDPFTASNDLLKKIAF